MAMSFQAKFAVTYAYVHTRTAPSMQTAHAYKKLRMHTYDVHT